MFYFDQITGCKSDDKECDSHCQFEGHQHNICKCTQNPIVSSKFMFLNNICIRMFNIHSHSM